MTVAELIAALQQMPPDARVLHLWDGAPRTEIENVWLARSGDVVTADFGEVCYDTQDRPATAPTEQDDRYWSSPEATKTEGDD